MNDPRRVAYGLADARRAARRFNGGIPEMMVIELGDQIVFACAALGVTVDRFGERRVVEELFLSELRSAAADVDPGAAPDDAVATALAVERATDDEIRTWTRPRDPSDFDPIAREEAILRARDRDLCWQRQRPVRGWRR